MLFRLRAHTYVFKKIRFRKDTFWGVHTYRTSIQRPHSHGRGLILGKVPPPENHGLCVLYVCWQRRTRLELKSHLFSLFPLLAGVVLLYCFTCLCPEEGVYVVWEPWRQVIKERLQRQHEAQTKDEAKWNKNKTPNLRLRRRRGRVASEDNSNHPPFCFRRQLPSKQKNELLPVSATRLQMRVKQYSSFGQAIFDRLGNSGRKDRNTMFTRKKDPDPKPPFSKDPLSGAFSKSSVLGPECSPKAPDTCGYVWPFLCIRGRKAPFSKKTRVRVHVALISYISYAASSIRKFHAYECDGTMIFPLKVSDMYENFMRMKGQGSPAYGNLVHTKYSGFTVFAFSNTLCYWLMEEYKKNSSKS